MNNRRIIPPVLVLLIVLLACGGYLPTPNPQPTLEPTSAPPTAEPTVHPTDTLSPVLPTTQQPVSRMYSVALADARAYGQHPLGAGTGYPGHRRLDIRQQPDQRHGQHGRSRWPALDRDRLGSEHQRLGLAACT